MFLRPKWLHTVRPAGLQIHLELLVHGKLLQFFGVCLRQRVKMPKHQRCRSLGNRNFNLWNTRPGIQLFNQSRQLPEFLTNRRVQNLAARQVRDIGTALLTEANQHPALFDDILYTQPSLGTVSPDRSSERRQHLFRCHLADVFKIIQ